MADVEFDEVGPAGPLSRGRDQVRQVVNRAGVLTSVALVLGVAVWGYRLVVRDVTGIPVIQALEGPLRIAPEDPGGRIAQNEGLSVNDVAAGAPVPRVLSRVVLAPGPISLSADDKTPADFADTSATPAARATASAGTALPNPAQPDAGRVQQVVVPQMGGPVVISPRPKPRPAHIAAAVRSAPKPVEVDAASLPAGSRLVQLGAFADIASARAVWTRLAHRFSALMGDKSRVIQKAQAGGHVFYRLRAAGFDGEADARRFCAALGAGNAACIPVILR